MKGQQPQRPVRLLCGEGAPRSQLIGSRRIPLDGGGSGSAATSRIKAPPPRSSSAAASSPSMTPPSSSSSSVAKRKVEELFRRLQPHTLVQSTEKLLAALRIAPRLHINGEELSPKAPPPPTAAAAAAATGSRRVVPSAMSWKFKPDAGRFHYGLSLQYSPSDTALTLASIKALSVTLSSTAMSTLRHLPPTTGEALGSKAWRLVAETEDPRVGIALYELPLGDWRASSLVALVWTQTREVSRLFLQLHTAELLHSAPQRALKVRRDDDLDRSHGLHSYTAAVSLRSLDQLFWEHEVYDVEFPTPEASSVTVQLLDDVHGGSTAARDRTLCSETDPALRVETEAITYAMRNCLLVDFTLWDADCMPVWAFSRALEITATSGRQQEDGYDDVDMSVSSAGEVIRRLELRFHDEARSNELVVRLMSLSPPLHQQTTKKTKLWVAQVSVTLSLSFINTTFGTKY